MSEIPRCVLGVMVERTRLQLQTAWVEVLGPGSQRDLGNVIAKSLVFSFSSKIKIFFAGILMSLRTCLMIA